METVIEIDINEIRPAPENEKLYRPVILQDPEVQRLAVSIKELGVREPLVVSADGFIISGHRRWTAARLAGLGTVPVRFDPVSRADDLDKFVSLLREHNRQRTKSLDEIMREEVVSADPEVAHRELLAHRAKKSDKPDFGLSLVPTMKKKARKKVSGGKIDFANAIISAINERQDFWPLSDRQVHYALLNNPPLRHSSKPDSRYVNDKASYKDTCDMLTRLRIMGNVPWGAIADETRPVDSWYVHRSAGLFISKQLESLFMSYRRDLQCSQPRHIEIVAEKLTVRSIIADVAREYAVPLTIGRGYSSIGPRYQIAERFKRSGKERLVLLIISDFDPDGDNIAESLKRSMRDDFGIEKIDAYKVALTKEQVARFTLPPIMKAKEGCTTRERFVEKNGENVFELEALAPRDLQEILRKAIDEVIDVDLYNAEVDKEKLDSAELDRKRRMVLKMLPEPDPEPPHGKSDLSDSSDTNRAA